MNIDDPLVQVTLAGSGVSPEISVTPLSIDYGDVVVGSSATKAVTIANEGTSELVVSSIGLGAATSSDFALTSGPSSKLVVNSSGFVSFCTYDMQTTRNVLRA